MKEFTKEFVYGLLLKEKRFKPGEITSFQKPDLSGAIWEYTLKRENEEYYPFIFALEGIRKEAWECGTHAIHSRRYVSLDQMFTDLLNNCNDNVSIKNKYTNTVQWLKEKDKC